MSDLLNEIILSIYQGILEDEPRMKFLVTLQTYFECDGAAMLLVTPNRKPDGKYVLNRMFNSKHKGRPIPYKQLPVDPFEKTPKNTPILLDELDHKHPMESNRFYKEVVAPSESRYVMAANILSEKTPDLILKLRLTRLPESNDFTGAEKQKLSLLIPHLKLAIDYFNLMTVQQIERNAYADAINQFRLGALVVDETGSIMASNNEAQQSIDCYDFLQVVNGKLKITIEQKHRQFCQALDIISEAPTADKNDACRSSPTTIAIELESGQNFSLMIREIREDDGFSHPLHSHAVVFLRDPSNMQHISPEILQELFGFTQKEANVAAFLAKGHSLDETATALSVSIHTIKTHTRNIYEKTGVHKQAKFIQLIASTVAGVY